MLREAHIPLALWLPAALLAHALFGGGAHQSAEIISERKDMVAYARSARTEVRRSLGETTVELIGEAAEPSTEELEPKDSDEPSDEKLEDQEPAEIEPPKPVVKPDEPKPEPIPPAPIVKPPEPEKEIPKPLVPLKPVAPPEKKDAPKPPEPKPPEPVAKAEEKKPEEKKAEDKQEQPQKIELPKPEGRIAVMNDPSLDKNQKDNPNAKRIADHANWAKEESMARFRSYDQNASKPTGGGNPEEADPNLQEPGNSTKDERGHSIANDDPGDPRPGSESGPEKPPDEAIARSLAGSNEPQVEQKATAAQKGLAGREAGKGERMPETVNGPGGGWTISPDGGDGRQAQKGRKGRKAIKGSPYVPGVPKPGALPQKYSITAYGLIDALGKEHIRKEQEKARNTRITRHRGRFQGNQFQKYRAAIENYDPSVKPGNQTSLNAARVPFASYINKMHNRIHPIFADGFLGSLAKLSSDDRLSDPKLVSHVEMVLDGETGAVVRAGIVKASGVTAFDVGALSSLNAAGPFGKAPDMIVSPDGNVYLHWEFYRDPYYACTSKFARPYIINVPTKKGPEAPTPTPPPPSEEASRGPLRPEQRKP